ncbi:nucleoporin Nup120/160-domain-containing protein [Cristinia sonorae]|uniref:Nucleoporin Nup120/160-domain-containing protein n=1 Tax=Cristinia sonorae TaxID=1940300 RepID=A0A8K0XTD9_9AGAR|nr:nucleoporin Nup120/160-domain-containing protein [Cristinia sonorae]
MDGSLIVAAQLSSLFTPYQASSIVLPTAQGDAPLPSATTNPDSPSEHAALSDFFSSPLTGTIVLRLIHNGLILELLSITHEATPIRIVFPAAVLPYPSLAIWEGRELHVLALTERGSLFRVVLPLLDGSAFWKQAHASGNYWFREYLVHKFKAEAANFVQVQGAHSVAIGLDDGSLVRLETRRMGHGSENDQWDEAIYSHSSIFNSLTSFLHASSSSGSEIISITSLPQPTDVGDTWTLSRDRTLRMWTVSGCVSAKALSVLPSSGRIASPTPGMASNAPGSLLQHHPQRLLRAFIPSWSNSPHILVFVPTESSSATAGFFQLFSTAGDHLHPMEMIECLTDSGHAHLQDFIVIGNTLYSLWDRSGQSIVAACIFHNPDASKPVWQVAAYPQEAELTPAYLDELLLSPGSLTDRYFEAVMRPGMFSPLTLQTALAQYTDSCLSHPSSAYARPPQLLTTYASLAESITAIVGCTVHLGKDPQTGAQQYDKYWNALKRDWEGFIARCREVERSARWPLAIGFDHSNGTLLVAERERIGIVTREDLPLQMLRLLSTAQAVQSQYGFLEILWTLRTRIGRRIMLSLESRLIDISHQEIAFPYADIILDQAHRANFTDDLDEGLAEWIRGRLQSVTNLDGATRMVLDVIGGCDQAVKREEEEVELLLPPPVLEWTRLLTVSYVKNSVAARYDLCLCLMALLFFLSEDLQQWDPTLLSEIFVVFRGIAMLRQTARQPAGEEKVFDSEKDDDMVVKMRNMNVSSGRSTYRPTRSLLHQLLARAAPGSVVPDSAHRFLDGSGLLQSIDPAHVTKAEVEFCNTLRALGYAEATRDAILWLPRTPGVCYVQALLWIDEGRYEDAAPALESLSSCFEGRTALTQEDADGLACVLPRQELFDSEFSFYLHAAALFRDVTVTSYEVSFTQLAISVAPVVNTMPLWSTVIRGLIELGLYDDAYRALISSPYEKLKQECVPSLVYRMCEEHAVDRLISFNFVGLNDEVEECLSFKARNADPRVRPFYSMILYTWFISRNDYRNAALTMYQRARKLSALSTDPAEFHSLAEMQLEACTVSINALSLVDPKSAWFVLPATDWGAREGRKRRKLSRFIPEEKYSDGKREVEIVELADIKHEYALLSAQVELVHIQPQLLFVNELLSQPLSVVLKLAQLHLFDTALATGQALGVDLTDVFSHLTNQCLRFSQNPDNVLVEETSDWLLTDKVSSWAGSTPDRAWRYLRQSLEQYDGPQSEYAYSKITLETVLAFERSSPTPPWLVQILADHHPEYLIRLCLRYDILEYALEHVINLISKNDISVGIHPPGSSATWLPYTLIDQVMVAAESQNDLTSRGQALRNQLRVDVSGRLKRMQKLSARSS